MRRVDISGDIWPAGAAQAIPRRCDFEIDPCQYGQ